MINIQSNVARAYELSSFPVQIFQFSIPIQRNQLHEPCYIFRFWLLARFQSSPLPHLARRWNFNYIVVKSKIDATAYIRWNTKIMLCNKCTVIISMWKTVRVWSCNMMIITPTFLGYKLMETLWRLYTFLDNRLSIIQMIELITLNL